MQRALAASRVFTRVLKPKNVKLNGVRMMGGAEVTSARQTAINVKGTISDIPVPQGSWQEYHSKRQATYNMLMALSAGFFAITVYVCTKGRVFFLNPPPDYKSIPVDARSETDEFKDQ